VIPAWQPVLEHEKMLFMQRNASLCGHVLVRVEATADLLTVKVSFTLDEVRIWHSAEAEIERDELDRETGPHRAMIAAFGELDEAIGMARLARLFGPASMAHRMAAGRA